MQSVSAQLRLNVSESRLAKMKLEVIRDALLYFLELKFHPIPVITPLIDLVGADTVCVAEPVLFAVPVRVVVAGPLVVKIAVLFIIVPTLPVGLMLTPLPPLEVAVLLTTAQIFGGIAAKTAMAVEFFCKQEAHRSNAEFVARQLPRMREFEHLGLLPKHSEQQ
ncbi:hypothetical protein KC316_g61 [Hortaea werneckii]|nr:hypothetical protein KC316_g61 [Hortaea werneckii]